MILWRGVKYVAFEDLGGLLSHDQDWKHQASLVFLAKC